MSAADGSGHVLVGGGFAALEVAIALRRRHPGRPVLLVSDRPALVYRPRLVRLPATRRPLEDVLFNLGPLADRHGFALVTTGAAGIDLDAQEVDTGAGRRHRYRTLLLATGAAPDRSRWPASGVLHPCATEDAAAFAAAAPGAESVAIVVGGERPGPGVEYAAWLARAGGPRVHVVSEDVRLLPHLGERGSRRVEAVLEGRGVTLHLGQEVTAVDAEGVDLGKGERVAAQLVAVVGPLRGAAVEGVEGLLDGAGFVRVADTFETARPGVFGFGDAAVVDGFPTLPRAMMTARSLAGRVAANLALRAEGSTPRAILDLRRPPAVMALPDLAGTTVLVRNQRVIASGRLPLVVRWAADAAYYRSRRILNSRSGRGPNGDNARAGQEG